MKLLVITQKVDKKDPVLGFFHRWIEVFSRHAEKTTALCLYKGEVVLPEDIEVLSLEKEKGESRFKYVSKFYAHVFREWWNYDTVFVHMNQEYILLAGLIWRLGGKKVFMWRNHHSGSLLTDIAAQFCTKVFCTSKFSYTAKYKKTELMPVGVDLENFKPASVARVPQSVLFLARIAPSKNPDLFIDSINRVRGKIPNITGSIYGDPLSKDESYYGELQHKVRKNNLQNTVAFHKGIPNAATVGVYSMHDIFINLSSSGMYDKTIFEAMACGCLILASNDNLKGQISDDFIFKYGDIDNLSVKLEKLLSYTPEQRAKAIDELQAFARQHSLERLGERLEQAMV